MLVTESEAEGLQCCGPAGSGIEHKGVRYCVASKCMAWRFAGWSSMSQSNTADKLIESDGHGPMRLQPQEPEGDGWRQVYPQPSKQWFGWTNWERPDFSRARGCCGLALDERFEGVKNLIKQERKRAAEAETD